MECRTPLFREIHKNTWLKRVTVDNRKIPVGTKKPERYWVVFCVHDDCEAHLEGYLEPRLASTHSPEWTVSLQSTLHISHTLVPSEQEYEFVITLLGDTVRFHASSWEIMQEWIETLRMKLREMKILSPNENLYSKLPEVRPPLLPTRDPMSPLPATPPVPAAIVPGVERITATTSQTTRQMPSTTPPIEPVADDVETEASSPIPLTATASTSSIPSTSMSNTLTQNLMKMLNDPVSTYNSQVNGADSDESTVSNDVDDIPSPSNAVSEPKSSLATTFVNNVLADPNTCGASTSGLSSYVSSTKRESNSTDNDNETSSLDSVSSSMCPTPEPIVIPRPQTIRKEKSKSKKKSIESKVTKEPPEVNDESATTTNITIIQVSSPLAKEKFKFDKSDDAEDEKYKSNVQIIPSNFNEKLSTTNSVDVSQVATVQVTSSIVSVTAASDSINTASSNESRLTIDTNVHVTNVPVGIADTAAIRSTPIQQHYEQVFIMASSASASVPSNNNNINNNIPNESISASAKINIPSTQPKSTSQTEVHVNRIKLQKVDPPHTEEPSTSTTSINTPLPTAAAAAIDPIRRPLLTRGVTEAVILRSSRKDQSQRSNPHREPTANQSTVQSLRNEAVEQRKRSSSTSDTQGARHQTSALVTTNGNNVNVNNAINNNNGGSNNEMRRAQPQSQPFRSPHTDVALHASGRLTMREQQVMQLRREMMHPGGVRLQLRRKDCINSIAFVDAFGAVWVAGWKQKEHPMLYNALHIGDQMVSIAGTVVHTSSEAHKIIRNSTGIYIEFIIRRVPFGRVYAIRREIDRQCLGLIRDGNTATIVDVVPNSLSARHGLPPKAQSCDGQSLSFWVLTEINGRPLNLFFKENEVRDRLNAVGRDISILVQPSDLITKLKKQLKSVRNHKDYIVQ